MSIDEKEIYIRPCGGKKDFTFDMFYEENGFNKKEPQVNDPFQISCSYKRSNKSSNKDSEKSLHTILQGTDALKEIMNLYTSPASHLLYTILSVPIAKKFHCVHKNIHWICERISPYYYDPTKAHSHRFLVKIIEILDINEYPPPRNPITYFTK